MTDPLRRYLARRADLTTRPLVSGPRDGIEQVVVIPVLAENGCLRATLETLARNPEPHLRRTLVICVVNNRAEHLAGAEAVRENRETLAWLDAAAAGHDDGLGRLRVGFVDAASPGREFPPKGGVGLARKLGLDWGLAVLAESAAPDAGRRLLISLDADTAVEGSYLAAIRAHFRRQPDAWAAVVAYAHPLEGPPEMQAAIICYELFLRYHVLGLRFAGSPYAFPSIGSTMVCRAEAYAAVSGMNPRQAGEDFYFLQQLAKTGGVDTLFGTVVYPSPRPSFRVPFGTGQRVRRFLAGERDEYRLYDPRGYRFLQAWLAKTAAHPDASAARLLDRARAIEPELGRFLESQRFAAVWPRLQKNSPNPETLRAQFHRWFDGFAAIKLLHHLRDNGYPDQAMFGALRALCAWRGVPSQGLDWDAMRQNLPAQAELLRRLREEAAAGPAGPSGRAPGDRGERRSLQ